MKSNALRTTLTVTALGLALVNLAVFSGVVGGPPDFDVSTPALQTWHQLSEMQQVAFAEQYQRLVRRADTSDVFRHAREFAGLAADDRERLREYNQLMLATLNAQPPTRRRELLRASPDVRAYFVYKAVRAESGAPPATQPRPSDPLQNES